jgi:hypothetical protein
MGKSNNRTVFQKTDGTWVNKRNDAQRAGSQHTTQQAANNAARTMIQKSGGGELTTKGANRNGARIVSKDTIGGGNDPRSIRDTEH